ncbi:proline--tRNA ligase [Ichthyobacterium seriolicida]|uniref:Proline--tRNA ligase n=1 Tax=Ichthyobacterium seriolicida TaxID=242600 RepID=A0A1J1DWQ1_9FLAO|nr:proline--tRNA ligase [Ichthyobacterium seriolicida]BAV94297.1 prolyl-tRNA synthetase [Ichthyobacterium seriolicida]
MQNYLSKKEEDYSKWYNELVVKAGLAENSGVKGCMVVKPYGYAIWEKIQAELDKRFKDTGHVNAYFPIFIPKSHMNKEAKHVDGFAKECAVVTHYRLKNDENGNLVVDENAKLEEELIVRPTSETIIWDTYRKWIQSYRDLPILINQWANVVRWEMRTRFFLRTTEFLWQEGHTAHATREEAIEEAKTILDLYSDFVQDFMAIPVIKGIKTDSERFAGADETFCIEALMQDGKALQAGTSHFLGQNFAKAFDVKFSDEKGDTNFVWATSWGVSTRLMGALIMTHSDNKGLVLPPKLAPLQVVIIPIYRDAKELKEISNRVEEIKKSIDAKGISVRYDDNDNKKPGWKFNEYELKGVPVRISIGMKELKENTVELVRRDTLVKEVISQDILSEKIEITLEDMQFDLLKKAEEFRAKNTVEVNSYEEFKEVLKQKGGFISAHWDGTSHTEEAIKKETQASIRCILLDSKQEEGKCIYSGEPSNRRVIFAKAY